MTSSTRDSLLHSIRLLLADAEKLPDDIFDDHAGRQSLQRQISALKNATATPFERVAELCFQVRGRDDGLGSRLLMIR